jgi:alkylated DNA repair dioxygenase AlkB
MSTVPGLRYLEHFLSPSEEGALLARIDAQPWRDDLQRRVQHYGYRYDYKARRVDASLFLGELPDWLQSLAERLHREGLFDKKPDQVILNEYLPGQGISAHVDCLPCFGPQIASLTLGAGCTMAFTHPKTEEKISQWLEVGSLVLLTGEARDEWRHSIAARRSDLRGSARIARGRRVSATFRTVRLQP